MHQAPPAQHLASPALARVTLSKSSPGSQCLRVPGRHRSARTLLVLPVASALLLELSSTEHKLSFLWMCLAQLCTCTFTRDTSQAECSGAALDGAHGFPGVQIQLRGWKEEILAQESQARGCVSEMLQGLRLSERASAS